MPYRPIASLLHPNLPAYHLTASNTSLGKTIFSTLLCRTLLERSQIPYYLKPVSTGPIEEADDGHIERYAWKTKRKCLFRYNEPVSPHLAAATGEAAVSHGSLLLYILSRLNFTFTFTNVKKQDNTLDCITESLNSHQAIMKSHQPSRRKSRNGTRAMTSDSKA
jgi:hypothetical protein